MLSIERLKIVPIEELKPGDIARLPDHNNALVIATTHDQSPFVFLELGEENFRLINRHDFYGPALVYEGVTFEVDPLTADRNEDDLGSLTFYREELQLCVKIRDRETYATIRSGIPGANSMRLFFKKWRAVIRDGDSEYVLFEHEVSSPQAFVLDVPEEYQAHLAD